MTGMIIIILFAIILIGLVTFGVIESFSIERTTIKKLRKIKNVFVKISAVFVVIVICIFIIFFNIEQNEINEREALAVKQRALAAIEKELKELNYSVNPKDYLVKLTDFAKNNDTSIAKYYIHRRYENCIDYEWIDVLRCKKENNNESICVPEKIRSRCKHYQNIYYDTIVENHGKWKSFKERDSAMNAWIKQNNELKDIYD